MNSLSPKYDYIQQPDPLPLLQAIPNFWWMVANPLRWTWDTLFVNPYRVEFFYSSKIIENFSRARLGDTIFGYSTSPGRKLCALAVVCRTLYYNQQLKAYGIDIQGIGESLLKFPVDWASLKKVIPYSEPVRCNSQGTLFALRPSEALSLSGLLRQAGNELSFPTPMKVVEHFLCQQTG